MYTVRYEDCNGVVDEIKFPLAQIAEAAIKDDIACIAVLFNHEYKVTKERNDYENITTLVTSSDGTWVRYIRKWI